MTARARRIAAVALVALPLAAALVPLALPPWTLSLVVARIATAELGPPIAVAALVLGAAAVALAWNAPRTRRLAGIMAVAAAGLALVPALSARSATGTAGLGWSAMPDALFGALRGLPAPPGVDERTVRYAAADGSPLELRRYRDRRRCPATCPTVVVLYGGAWRNGTVRQSAPIDRWIAAHGFTVVALDYRHAPAHRFPAQPDDVHRGLALLRDSAAAWGADPTRVALWGRSSGAHLALLAAWRDPAPPVTVRGVIDFYGPFDLARGYVDRPTPDPIDARAVLRAFVGGTPDEVPNAYRDASPAAYVRPGLPPTLLVYAGEDHLVKPEFGRAAAAALRAAGNRVTYVELPFAEHGFDLAPGGPSSVAALAAVLEFLTAVL